jgi:hypothetical protein
MFKVWCLTSPSEVNEIDSTILGFKMASVRLYEMKNFILYVKEFFSQSEARKEVMISMYWKTILVTVCLSARSLNRLSTFCFYDRNLRKCTSLIDVIQVPAFPVRGFRRGFGKIKRLPWLDLGMSI